MSKDEKVTNAYNEDSIQVLEGLEAVRKRPGMYIGSVSIRGLHHLIYEIVDNSVDEALAGYCTEINVTLNKDNSVTVKDNGRGIPVGIHHKMGIPTVEVVFTILHAWYFKKIESLQKRVRKKFNLIRWKRFKS